MAATSSLLQSNLPVGEARSCCNSILKITYSASWRAPVSSYVLPAASMGSELRNCGGNLVGNLGYGWCLSLKSLRRRQLACKSVGRALCIEARARKGRNGSGGGGRDRVPNLDPLYADGSLRVECPVPWEQQPVNEYQMLVQSFMFAWAAEDVKMFSLKLAAIGVAVSGLLGWPIAAVSISLGDEPWECALAAICAGIVASTLVALRLYIGWSHVGNRLFSATVEYEESGWYDGEVWAKPREVMTRDRLLGVHEVKPVLNRLKGTLTALGISLTACILLFLSVHESAPRYTADVGEDEGPEVSIGSPYSDASARRFEPEAFGTEDLPSSSPSSLPDYCR